MNPERWQQASRILESVLERAPDQRPAYLDEVCANDVGLRREVDSLLAASQRAGSLLDSPAMTMAAPLFVNDSVESMLGQSIGRYKIIAAVGAGGMGEVYLAHDTSLGREIALKLLPAHFITDKDRLRRFEQEAHAASTLSNANVCVIHEVGETENGHHYIAMEFVNGVTLRQHLAGAQLELIEALEVAIQVASALAATHRAGIVHRDIKPENIMVRGDGVIKVLDFGLAKLTEETQPIDSNVVTQRPVQTDAGIVMGTTSYMSPEQARGLAVDSRTDIWSLGVVLYEMLAGRPPFEGETSSDLIAAILKTEPPPFSFYSLEVPVELEQIVRKALQKDREARPQTAGDLLTNLKEIKQELEFQAKLERSPRPGVRDPVDPAMGIRQADLQTEQVKLVHSERGTPAGETLGVKYLVNEISRHKPGAFVSLAILLGIVGTLAYFIYQYGAPRDTNSHFQKIKLTRLTTAGNVHGAAVSPDGKLIAYVQTDNENHSLWTKEIAGGRTQQIVPPAEGMRMYSAVFSIDGNYVYYTVREKNGPGILHQVPVEGGTSKRLLEKRQTEGDTGFSFSPDGKHVAFVSTKDYGESQLIVSNPDGSDERILVTRASGEGFSIEGPSWSPDGKIMAIAAGMPGSTQSWTVLGVTLNSLEVKPLTQHRWDVLGRVEWFRDGSGMALIAMQQGELKGQIWRLSYPSGETHRLTNDLGDYGYLNMTADSSVLVATLRQKSSNIWVAANGDASKARQLTFSNNGDEGRSGMAWTPEGNIVYCTNGGGEHSNIWSVNSDGTNPRQLTRSSADDFSPAVSPDGRYIVFVSTRSGKHNLWRVDMDGSNPKQLTSNGVGMDPAFSPDGRWVACTFGEYWAQNVWRVPIDGSSPVQLTDTSANRPAVSSSGKLIAYFHYEVQPRKETKIVVVSSEGGAPVKVLNVNSAAVGGLAWSPDDRSIMYVDAREGGANLWRLPLDGSPAKQLTDFKSQQIWNFYFTRDGRQLACSRGTMLRDAVMISDSE